MWIHKLISSKYDEISGGNPLMCWICGSWWQWRFHQLTGKDNQAESPYASICFCKAKQLLSPIRLSPPLILYWGCIKIEISFHFVILNGVKGLEYTSWCTRDSSLCSEWHYFLIGNFHFETPSCQGWSPNCTGQQSWLHGAHRAINRIQLCSLMRPAPPFYEDTFVGRWRRLREAMKIPSAADEDAFIGKRFSASSIECLCSFWPLFIQLFVLCA